MAKFQIKGHTSEPPPIDVWLVQNGGDIQIWVGNHADSQAIGALTEEGRLFFYTLNKETSSRLGISIGERCTIKWIAP